jgi:signal transduction histidine kinase
MATILVVDDKALNRSVLKILLGYRGHRVIEACDGVEALHTAQTESPELIITDILMPNMDGYELVQRLRKTDAMRDVKVIFYSALYREHEARTLAAACGVSQIICKPTDPEEILRVVNDLLTSEHCDGVIPFKPETHADLVSLLSNKLYQKVAELEELNAALEKRVARRTKELEEINRNLQEQIVQREKAEEAAASDRENKLKMKGDFLSHVSHELRSPLTVVHQFVSILLDGLGGSINANQKEYLEIALRNVNQLKCMIDDLLEASRADTCKLTVKQLAISAGDLLNQTICSFRATAAAKDISLQTYIPGNLPPVYADPARICQVLTNLLDNAVKFSPSKSFITVRAQILDEDSNFVCISVADSVCGIEPQESEQIFERLYQVKNSLQAARRGLGLGLYICKELITLQGGRIWNDSKRLGGCTISFTLPVFSIGSMIAPIIKKGTLVDSSFALVTVEVHAVKAWPSERERERALLRIYHVIDRCILPDLDVLLPPQNRAGVDFFWIVACTDQRGADVIVKRVREQISLCEDLKLVGISCTVSSEVLNPGTIESEWSLERQVQCVVSCLERLLQFEPTERRTLR